MKMKRSLFQAFVKESDKAVELYKKAFDVEVVSSYPNPDGTYAYLELDIYGQILAISEAPQDEAVVTGNSMMLCLQLGPENEAVLRKIYEVLKEGATNISPLAPCMYSPLEACLVDKFGVRWCIFL